MIKLHTLKNGVEIWKGHVGGVEVYTVEDCTGGRTLTDGKGYCDVVGNAIMKGMHKKRTRYHDDCEESGIHWWTFPIAMSDEDITNYIDTYWLDSSGTHWSSQYDCTGRYFADSVWIRRSKTRVLVTQSWGHDV